MYDTHAINILQVLKIKSLICSGLTRFYFFEPQSFSLIY